MQDERLKILEMLQAGQIDARQAAELLSALGPTQEGDQAPATAPGAAASGLERRQEQWARFWVYPMLAGGGVLIAGSLALGLAYASGAAWGWRAFCGWLPLVAGSIIIALAWWSRRAKWLHLRVKEEEGRQIAFSFPLPLTLAAWALRLAQPFVPRLKDTGVDDLIIALRNNPPGEPLTLDVEDGEKGEHVQISIG